ncbi:MAG: transcription antitermination factor NusB [Mycobacteriales bacterium]
MSLTASGGGAREVALEVLGAVEERGAYANLVLPRALRRSRLDARDRALATELTYGTLRAQGTLDHVLGACSTRPVAELTPAVRRVLRLAAYQLLHTRVPAHAAVSAAVDQARRVAGGGAVGFTNAVLRCVAVRAAGLDPLGLAAVTSARDRLGLEHAHPGWIVDAFAAALHGDLAETGRALAADNGRPEVHLVARPGRIDRDELLALAGPGARPGRWSPYSAVLSGGGDPGRLAPVRDGRAGVQDEGSQLVALALYRALPGGCRRAPLVVDLCAGPGGKAALLAGLLANGGEGGRVLAVEPAAHRARLVAASGVGWVVRADGRRPPVPPASADAVLVDAPCTGLGALRRRPEARWRRRPEELPGLVALQGELLRAALALVRPGGVVAYAVCSPVLAEADPGPVEGTELLDAPALAGVPGTPGSRLQLWPHRHGTDAMSLLLLRRRAGRWPYRPMKSRSH